MHLLLALRGLSCWNSPEEDKQEGSTGPAGSFRLILSLSAYVYPVQSQAGALEGRGFPPCSLLPGVQGYPQGPLCHFLARIKSDLAVGSQMSEIPPE